MVARRDRTITGPQAAKGLAYAEQALAGTHLSAEHRLRLESKAAFYRRALVGCCKRCHVKLADAASIERGYGSECAKYMAGAS